MLYRDYENQEWKLMPLTATFLQHEQEHEQYVISEVELRAHEEMAHIDELVFKDAEYDAETLSRLDEVKGYPESELITVEGYVVNNNIVAGTNLAIQKQNELLEDAIMELTMMQMGGGF